MKKNLRTIFGCVFLFLILPTLAFTVSSSQWRQEELAKLSVEELVQRYVRLDPIGDKNENALKEAIKATNPNEVFAAISQIINQYDPRRYTGRWRNKSSDSYWAIGLLVFIDENQIRARGVEEGRKAIAAFEQMLEKMKQAGYDNEKKGSLNARYRGQMLEFQGLKSSNGQDFHIAEQLKEEYQIEISREELKRFSDFLTAKDPRYVAWSKSGVVSKKPLRYRILDMHPYFQAYLEFQKTVDSNSQK